MEREGESSWIPCHRSFSLPAMFQGRIWEADASPGEGTAGKSGFCWLQVQPRLREGAETFPSLQEYIKKLWNTSISHLSFLPAFPSYFCSAGSSGTLWQHHPAGTSLSKAFPVTELPNSTEDAQGWLQFPWEAIGSTSRNNPGLQQGETAP